MLNGLRGHFSFAGRANRKEWWRAQFIYFSPLLLLAPILQQDETAEIAFAILLILIVPLGWLATATTIRRLRDRGRSGLFLLIIPLIPLVGPIWLWVECGFLPRHEVSPPWNWPRTSSATS